MDPFCSEAEMKTVFFESKHFRALYDIRPVVPGHIVIAPKRHMLDIIDLTAEELNDLHSLISTVIPKLLKLYSQEEKSYDITSQIGPYSGRTVLHLHFHVLPRTQKDQYQKRTVQMYVDIENNRANYGLEYVENEVAKLRKLFGYKK